MADTGKDTSYGRSTLAIHGGRPHPKPGESVVPPLYQSVNHVQQAGSTESVQYTRYANTPNVDILQRRIALLEGAEASAIMSSGMGATACVMRALLRPGDHLITSEWIYGGTWRLFEEELPEMGVSVTAVNPMESRSWRKALTRETRAIFVESPVNPTTRILDLKPLSMLAREIGIALIVDSTLASPALFRPIEHGADLVVHSATKFLNGHHDVLAGVVSGTQSVIEEVTRKMMVWGQVPDPFSLWLLERGLKTLDVRVKRQCESAMQIAKWAEKQESISQVLYPGLPSHPDHDLANRTLDGYGSMLGFTLKDPLSATSVVEKLRIVMHAPSLGGVDSLVCEPRYTSHSTLTSSQRAAAGFPDGFLRLSVGLENVDDLIADLSQAMEL